MASTSRKRENGEALVHRLEQWSLSGAPQRFALIREATDGMRDIQDDYFESCRSVLVFELWKIKRAALWDDWLAVLKQNVIAFIALQDRQAFAGQLYHAALQERRQALDSKRQQMNALLSNRSAEQTAFVANLVRPPLFLAHNASKHAPDSKNQTRVPHSESQQTKPTSQFKKPHKNPSLSFADRVRERLRRIGDPSTSSSADVDLSQCTAHNVSSIIADRTSSVDGSRHVVSFHDDA